MFQILKEPSQLDDAYGEKLTTDDFDEVSPHIDASIALL